MFGKSLSTVDDFKDVELKPLKAGEELSVV